MKKQVSGKRYFYALGQSARDKGLTKEQGMNLFKIPTEGYAQIYFDKGYRKLSL